MNLIERAIVGLCRLLLWISTAVIFVILVVNTMLRYATGSSLQWANEVPELLFPWLVMSGVVLAAAHGAHITTSFLMDAVPAALRRWTAIGTWLVVAALYGTLAKSTFQMLEIVHDEKSAILQLPGSLTYGCVMGGLLMLSLLALKSAWNAWLSTPVEHDPSEEPAVPEAHW
ncbi:TRAP transporter small permease [Malikia spinosa]|uniref:TRAP transporter small permease protein n=1 Tax=Malikia spinosa TaxID=86180 RepID=A0A2S9KIT3_9BURK|nr:TRAP transporter small permease subunit [Malikia spinosa]MYZ52630.1 TRAP transporter small permease subunit [Malikia spinosa]OGB71624.1 MAG: C4-dicarboxylate ABC transporter permease [Burkholderiales bacterium RIFOXYC12_FULL_65_23]PRD70327.1 TRAP transporter small permease [Malikia spinosa]